MSENGISLVLTPGQVVQVLKAAGGVGQQALLAEVGDPRELVALPLLEGPTVAKSLLLGLVVLVSFPLEGTWRANKDVAQELGLAASTTHRYIKTLAAVGLLEQDPLTRQYRRTQFPSHGGRCGRAGGGR